MKITISFYSKFLHLPFLFWFWFLFSQKSQKSAKTYVVLLLKGQLFVLKNHCFFSHMHMTTTHFVRWSVTLLFL